MIETTVVASVPVPAGSSERWRGECPTCEWRGEPRRTQAVARGEALSHERVCAGAFQLELVFAA